MCDTDILYSHEIVDLDLSKGIPSLIDEKKNNFFKSFIENYKCYFSLTSPLQG